MPKRAKKETNVADEDELVALFERDQKDYGTAVAVHNLVWLLAADMMHQVGVKQIKTLHKFKGSRKTQKRKKR